MEGNMIIHDYDIITDPVISLESFYGKQKKDCRKVSDRFFKGYP